MIDVPGPAIGPLQMLSVDADSVLITWQPPLDNGGSSITGYFVDYKEIGNDLWSNVTTCTAKTKIRVRYYFYFIGIFKPVTNI